MSDEHAPQFSSVYGHPIVRTPNMERLAAEGTVFDAAYCASPICVPSRASFLTARLPSRTEVWDNGTPLASDLPTLAHALRHQGYETVLIGKMHFIGTDQLHGFEKRLVDDSRVCGTWIESTDWDHPDLPRAKARLRATNAGPGHTAHIEQDEAVLEAALGFLDAIDATDEERRPLFLCISFNAPHFPLRAPAHFDSYWPENVDAPEIAPNELEGQHPFHQRLRRYFDLENLSGEETLRARAALYALTTWLDDCLGAVIDRIDAVFAAATVPPLVGYVSDHGDMAGEHGLWWKCCFFEESVRVPLILRWPGHVGAGHRIATPVSLMDLAVTLADIAGAGTDDTARIYLDDADGRTLLPLLKDATHADRAVIAEYLAHAAGRPIRMIRRGRWKYVYYHGETDELYDLTADPKEKANLADDPDHADVVAALRKEVLEDWDPEDVDRRVRLSQQRRRLIASTESRGSFE
jgi:choline-sulfatase